MKAALKIVLLLSASLLSCGDDTTEPELVMTDAAGVAIDEVAIYQGLKRDLMLGSAVSEGGVPLVAGRDAVIRVFYTADASYDGAEVVGRLEIDGAEPIEVTGKLISSDSTDDYIDSTVNFAVPGSLVTPSLAYRVSLLQLRESAKDSPAARWPAEGNQAVTVEGAPNTLRVLLTPIRYDFDGSGRLPDVSEAVIEQYRARLQQLYPVSSVEISLREAMPWDGEISPDGSGWNEIIERLIELRMEDGAPPDLYYYGVFNPQETLAEYCFAGCLLGATLLNGGPDEGDVDLRLALGLGYPEYSVNTIAHELGHAHGRKHADCGPGIDPSSIDIAYPYEDGQIGVWGLDPATMQLYPPAVTSDVMGYCPFQWVSDYTYRALLDRGSFVNMARWHEPTAPRRFALLSLAPGGVTWKRTLTMTSAPKGRRGVATIADAAGALTRTEAAYYRFDHLPGGLAFVPIPDAAIASIEIEIDGTRVVVLPPGLE